MKFSGVTTLMGDPWVKFSVSLLILEWALQLRSATALPLITTFTVDVTPCDLEKSFGFDMTVEITVADSCANIL